MGWPSGCSGSTASVSFRVPLLRIAEASNAGASMRGTSTAAVSQLVSGLGLASHGFSSGRSLSGNGTGTVAAYVSMWQLLQSVTIHTEEGERCRRRVSPRRPMKDPPGMPVTERIAYEKRVRSAWGEQRGKTTCLRFLPSRHVIRVASISPEINVYAPRMSNHNH